MSQIYRSRSVKIRNLLLGGDHPVRIQSMTNTDTNDVIASVSQCECMIAAGTELVRFTTQGRRELENLGKIMDQLHSKGLDIPIVADIHFKPDLALDAAPVADKIRINPGNYLKGKSVEKLLPALLHSCKQHNTAIRIGVNHGSLDESILKDFGDTPAGMVESAMQFLRVCQRNDFHQVVVSMKSSNPVVMIQSVRLLVKQMTSEGMCYPLHLGVTEAGDGMDGRIKSIVGIAPLLLEGMGDTIRVSLTEPPEEEMPVAASIIELFSKPDNLPYDPLVNLAWDPFSFRRRKSKTLFGVGGASRVKIISKSPPETGVDLDPAILENQVVTYHQWMDNPEVLAGEDKFLLLHQETQSIQEVKGKLNEFCARNLHSPVIFKTSCHMEYSDPFSIKLAGELGSLLVDGCLDAVWVENPFIDDFLINDLVLMILQASGARISKTEYIACPSCGRTHFDILARLKEIRNATSHLTSLKFGVMGCIVNGPGEMADANYGYVGAGPGRVTIYKGREPRQKNIPEEKALNALISLVKAEGDWIDP